MRGKPNGERRTTRRETSCGVENCFLWDRKQINSQSAKGGKKRGINRKGSKFNTFTIRLRIFVPGNLLTKLGKLAATAMLLSRPDLYFIPRLLLPSRFSIFLSFSLILISTCANATTDYKLNPIQIYRGRTFVFEPTRLCFPSKLLSFAIPLPIVLHEFCLSLSLSYSNTFSDEFFNIKSKRNGIHG